MKKKGDKPESVNKRESGSPVDSVSSGQNGSSENPPGDSLVKSASRTLKILSLLANNPEGVTAKDVSHILDIPPASAHILMQTIWKDGYADRDEESKLYTLGSAASLIGESASLSTMRRLKKFGNGHLRDIVQKTHIPAHIAILVHGEVSYIDRVGVPSYVNESMWVNNVWAGRTMTPHATAVGQILMCYLKPELIKEIFESHPLPTNSPARWRTLPELMIKLAETRRRGYAFDDEETALGVRCVAAPVFGVEHRVVAAIGVSGKAVQLEGPRVEAVAKIVCMEATKLSRELGYDGSKRGRYPSAA